MSFYQRSRIAPRLLHVVMQQEAMVPYVGA